MHQSNKSDFNPFTALKLQGRKVSQTSAEFVKSFTNRRIAPLSLITLLGWGGISWVATSVITPQVAQAYTARVDLSLSSQLGETYEGFVRRAEAAARAAAQRSFDRDILVTEVSVTILGQNQGSIAPVLTLDVTRQAWKSRPDPRRWTRYFPTTRSLLGFVEGVPVAQPAPATAPEVVPAAPVPAGIPTVNTPAPTDVPTVPGTQTPPQPGVPNAPPSLTPGDVAPGVGTGINPQGGPTVPTTPGGTPNTIPRTTPGGLNSPGSTGGGNPNTVPRTTPGGLTQ